MTPRPTLYAHEETLGGSANWEPILDDIYIPVEEKQHLKKHLSGKRKCGFCGKNTNKHTKSTCPKNPKYIAKLARVAAAQKGGTDAGVQQTRNVATEKATNAS